MGVSLGGDVGWERKPSELSIGIEPIVYRDNG